jgi:cellobiose phosphorylase
MRCGYFDHENHEYVITAPKTPVKWINYIGTLSFGGFVDQTGGGVICCGDPAVNRIVKYIPQLPDSDMKGETLYLRIREGDGYRLFSPLFVPTLDSYDRYECHVGLGYSRVISEFYDVRTTITIFVPLGGHEVLRKIEIVNLSDHAREIDLVPVVEYTHPKAILQFNNADWVPQTQQSRLVEDGEYTLLRQCPFMNIGIAENYFTSSMPASSFETDRQHFLGDGGYGSWAHPLALECEELGDHQANRGDNIAALMHHLGRLEPGGGKTLVTQLGQVAAVTDALPAIRRYRDQSAVDRAFDELTEFWDSYLLRFQVQTPDEAMNAMLNSHHPHQCYVTMQWSRYLSLYQLGLGLRGIGYRDSSQDAMGVFAHVPGEGRELLQKIISVQRPDGSAMHSFNPRTMEGSAGEAGHEGRLHYYGDDHLWAVLAASAYVRETGDLGLLDIDIVYYQPKPGGPAVSGTVLDHLMRALEFTRSNLGTHGLPLLGFADWNDSVNLMPGAESVFIAFLYGYALLELIDVLAERSRRRAALGDQSGADDDMSLVDRYRTDYDQMKALVNEHAWDGNWYRRYFDRDGTPIGSVTNEHGKIFTNAQSWSVISGFADSERALSALDAVREYLNTRHGIKLFWPGYSRYDPDKGGVTTYPPGTKENGGIFLHANPWVMIAEALCGRAEQAHTYYTQINPAARNDRIEEYEVEPYCYAQNILSDEHPQFGLGRNSWLSGTATWTYQAATQYILGIRPVCAGLVVDPCIPSSWDGYSASRAFRGATYRIRVENPHHVSSGVVEARIDGDAVDLPPIGSESPQRSGRRRTGVLFAPQSGDEHEIIVILGSCA